MTEKTTSDKPKSYTEAKVNSLPKGMTEITASVPSLFWEKFRKEALKNLNSSVTIDGFRKGNIPENILISKIGEMAVLEEMAELALPVVYMEILLDKKVDAIGKPMIQVTKLATGNPLEFKAVTAVVPEVILPDYKKLSAETLKKTSKDKIEVTDKDMEDAILRIRKLNASHEDHDHEKMTPEEHEKKIMENLPELNDEFVAKIGEFKTVAEFKDKLKVMLLKDKEDSKREKTRIAIADAIATEAKMELPDIMIQTEVNRTEAQFKSDIERMGITLDDYLKHAKKTLEDVRKEWAPAAEKKAKLQLVLNEIARTEKIKPTDAEIQAEVKHITEHYKDADLERAQTYAETVLTNDKVFEFLEAQK